LLLSFRLPAKKMTTQEQQREVTAQFFVEAGKSATLANEQKLAGTYKQQWNTSNLPSGVYFLWLQVGTFIETKKLILLR